MGALVAIRGQVGEAAARFTHPMLPDDLLGTLNPMWSRSEPHARVVGVRPETDDTPPLCRHPSRWHPAHRAGQFVGVGTRLEGVWHWRTSSVTSARGVRPLAITV